MGQKLLLHACCGPCAVMCVESLRDEDLDLSLFWYNPNIHPVTEYNSRRNALVQFAQSAEAPLIMRDEYGLRLFLDETYQTGDKRCVTCYRLRLEAAARTAAEQGFDCFSTTLLISPYQNHESLRTIGEEAAQKVGVTFLYRDFRPLFRAGQQKAKELGLYRQKYCGCIFSEEERYR